MNKKLTLEDLQASYELLKAQTAPMQPFEIIEREDLVHPDQVFAMDRKIYVNCIYKWIFGFEKDFDKALNLAAEFAKGKVNRHVKEIHLNVSKYYEKKEQQTNKWLHWREAELMQENRWLKQKYNL